MPGDGVGPEVISEVKKIIQWLNKEKSLDFQIDEDLIGGASIDVHTSPITDEVLYKSLEFIELGLLYSAVFLISILLSFVNLIVAPIGLIGKTPHSFGEPINSNSLSVNDLVILAVNVIGKL